MVLSDERFEIPAKRHLGMVVFRLKGDNDQTEKLLKKLNGSGKSLENLFSLGDENGLRVANGRSYPQLWTRRAGTPCLCCPGRTGTPCQQIALAPSFR